MVCTIPRAVRVGEGDPATVHGPEDVRDRKDVDPDSVDGQGATEPKSNRASLTLVRPRRRATAALLACATVMVLGADANGAVAESHAAKCTITGTTHRDVLYGTNGNDVICGRAGNDVLLGKGGDDILRGGAGSDFLHPGFGYDVVRGGGGADFVSYAGHTNPVLVNLRRGVGLGMGKDAIRHVEGVVGSRFGDELIGDAEGNVLKGRAGHDVVKGLAGDDSLTGGKNGDRLYGGPGSDELNGGPGPDVCRQGLGFGAKTSCP